ncbi:MAG: hypothetical protein Q9218_003253 [Villophora microphyllina]
MPLHSEDTSQFISYNQDTDTFIFDEDALYDTYNADKGTLYQSEKNLTATIDATSNYVLLLARKIARIHGLLQARCYEINLLAKRQQYSPESNRALLGTMLLAFRKITERVQTVKRSVRDVEDEFCTATGAGN